MCSYSDWEGIHAQLEGQYCINGYSPKIKSNPITTSAVRSDLIFFATFIIELWFGGFKCLNGVNRLLEPVAVSLSLALVVALGIVP